VDYILEWAGKCHINENTLTCSASESGLEYILESSSSATNSIVGNGSMKSFADRSEK
jgi:hypothetical protein